MPAHPPQLHYTTTDYSLNLMQLNETVYERGLSLKLWIIYGNATTGFLSHFLHMLSSVPLFETASKVPRCSYSHCMSMFIRHMRPQ